MEGAVQGAVENPLVTVHQWTGAKTPPWDGPAQFQGFTDWEEKSCPQSGAEDRERESEINLPTDSVYYALKALMIT